MTTPEITDRLAHHKLLAAAPREELAWLVAHGALRTLEPGEILSTKGQVVAGLYIVLSGRIAMIVDRGAGPQIVTQWREGSITGVLPYSRLTSPPGNAVTQETSEIFAIPRANIPELILNCYEVTSILVHVMLDRAREFNSSDLQNEKMVSLGKLSAGLAHELNNPASAIERGAALLEDRLEESERAARSLGAARLSDSQLAAVDAARTACIAKQVHGVRSPIEQVEREEAIADWLAKRGLDVSFADELSETAVTFEALDSLAAAVTGPALNSVLHWAAAGCAVRGLSAEIQDAAMRISGLVTAIKGFTHMDQATVPEPVDLVQSLGSTVAVLKSKARAKSASVIVTVEPDLPHALGLAGELNQIWANLIDNALDAIPESGRIEILAGREANRITVRIVDDGAGIPEQIRARIFDPFFTTKPMGAGTGLGLDIVRRLVRHNDGEISVESKPGRTEFRVSLPIAPTSGGAGNK